MPNLDGFDVYHGNGNPFPWADMVTRYRITLGCCKVSEGTGFVDPAWGANRAGMSKAGLRYMGLYHWLSPDQPLDAQLRNFQRIGSLQPGEFTMLDLEPTPGKVGPSKQMCLDACALWAQTFPGRFIRYQGKFFADGDSDDYAAYLWWLAYYGPSTLPATHLPVTIWQWGGGALGIEHFDSNQIIDLAAVEGLAGYVPIPVPEPPQTIGADMKSGHYRDDRPDVDGVVQWQVWWVNRDWTDSLYAYPVNDMPRGGDYDLLDQLPDELLVAKFSVLVAIMNRQNRPTPLPVAPPADSTVPRHRHLGGVMGPTGDVVGP